MVSGLDSLVRGRNATYADEPAAAAVVLVAAADEAPDEAAEPEAAPAAKHESEPGWMVTLWSDDSAIALRDYHNLTNLR